MNEINEKTFRIVLSFVEAPPTPMDHVTDRRPGCVESILMLAAS